MTKKKGKSVSFDAMVKFFLQNYNIPTKQDIDRLTDKVERLEKLVTTSISVSGRRTSQTTLRGGSVKSGPATAADLVLEIIKRFRNGVGFADIQMRTGYDEKKLRNIIFRLSKMQKISRKSRGIYVANTQ